ncbi:MAG TPA: enoyl-CoA hydratase [Myxococcales bacterium]|nr:enoyl-CoA hydratase [Myxococcales bacterium]
MSQHVLTELDDRILRVELARPEKKNALTPEMYRALSQALARADSEARVRAVLIHGKPDCFCAGNDLADFLQRPSQAGEPPAIEFLRRIATVRKPLVAAVGGPAVGIGTTMLLHCDFVYAAPETRFQLPFVPLGIVPEAASSLLLPLIAGQRRAAELLLLGQPFDAAKAVAAGIITAVVEQAGLLEHARGVARALAALPPESVRLTKELMKRELAPAVAARMRAEGQLFQERLSSPEAKEAFTAFFEKRKPDFSRFD